jgi:hypothetical protein
MDELCDEQYEKIFKRAMEIDRTKHLGKYYITKCITQSVFEYLEDECNCVLPVQSCPVCREAACKLNDEEIPYY